MEQYHAGLITRRRLCESVTRKFSIRIAALAKIIKIADLSHRQRNIVRGVAIRAWEGSVGDADLAILRLSERLPHSFGTIYQPAAVSLGAKLVRHWSTRKITEPQAVFVAGEPGCSEGE